VIRQRKTYLENMSNQPTKRMPFTERRHCTRRVIDGIKARLNVPGACIQGCTVRCLSSNGIFIDPVAALDPGLRVELAYTCQYTRQVIKIYRRSTYVARVADNGTALLYSDKHRLQRTFHGG
jgi:hypothetical protein